MNRDPRMDRMDLHPLAPAFQRSQGGPMDPACGDGLPPGLRPMRGPGQGLAPNFVPQVPPIAAMVPAEYAPDQLLRVPGFGAIANEEEGASRPVEFPDDGWVIGMIGVARANGTIRGQSSLQFKATVGEEVGQFVTQGLDQTWATFGMFGANEWEWQPMARRVSRLERWNITCRNIGTTTGAYTPDITLQFRALRAPGMYAPMEVAPGVVASAPIVLAQTPPNRIVRVDGLTQIPASSQGNQRTVQFPEDGIITAILATAPYQAGLEESGESAMQKTALGVQIQWGDTGGYFTTDGSAADYALLSCWGNTRAKWMPYFRAVQRDTKYTITTYNFHPSVALDPPDVLFKFRSIRSLGR